MVTFSAFEELARAKALPEPAPKAVMANLAEGEVVPRPILPNWMMRPFAAPPVLRRRPPDLVWAKLETLIGAPILPAGGAEEGAVHCASAKSGKMAQMAKKRIALFLMVFIIGH